MTAADSSHECPAPGCKQRVPFDQFACRGHWFMIPKPARDELWRQYRRHFGEDSYFHARANCLRALGVPEDRIADENGGVT